jgi:hypothetical protein
LALFVKGSQPANNVFRLLWARAKGCIFADKKQSDRQCFLEAQPALIGHLVAKKLLSPGSPEHDGTPIVDFYKNDLNLFKKSFEFKQFHPERRIV